MTLYAVCVALKGFPWLYFARLHVTEFAVTFTAACVHCVLANKSANDVDMRRYSEYIQLSSANIFARPANRVPVANLCLKGSLTTLLGAPKNVAVKAGD